ncbi:hypothetical protein HNR65_002432 [Desulfosalsimonas propionicica]|uniref:MnmG N-terminal domain-containing protein n=1 Tax=Desulfosalsimonas propionicica TaxID=332175 RepID=A0A7W0CAD2_9BACT|nr:FAD-dependent oxidoreductase [Desulfosalsimonas propionicica]MBA2882091.1 hypothetical protein [Desulfosalsimonas propionicica]
MARVIVIGGGWAGCAAALTARKAGASVVLLERTDMLLGCGLAGGIMRNNGRFTAAEELIAMGGGELISITDEAAQHKNVSFPGHEHATLYSSMHVEPKVRGLLTEKGVQLNFCHRVVDVVTCGRRVESVVTADDVFFDADVFVETTGSAGPMGNCSRYGNGCGMCVLRCPAFGPRVSIAHKAGIKDDVGLRNNGSKGSFSGSCELNKDSLHPALLSELESLGSVILPVPGELVRPEMAGIKACRQYSLPAYIENLILLDTGGYAKMMSPFYPLEMLRRFPGLENATYAHSCGHANSVRFLSRAPRDNSLKVCGSANLFCAGEKSGFFVGHTEAMVTGSLAGLNAVKCANGHPLIEIPRDLVAGDLIAFEEEALRMPGGLKQRYTFSGGIYFERMCDHGLYTTATELIARRVRTVGMEGLYLKSNKAGTRTVKLE